METNKILNIVWSLDCHRFPIETSRSITKYQLYDKLSDFIKRQKNYHRRLIHGHRNYYSLLGDAPSFRWSEETFIYMFSLCGDPDLQENNYGMVELFIRDATQFGVDLTHFMSTHFDVPYNLRAGIEVENAKLLWWDSLT